VRRYHFKLWPAGSLTELERKYGLRPWLALPTNELQWPPDRDDISTTA
jgi:hypothetical protein